MDQPEAERDSFFQCARRIQQEISASDLKQPFTPAPLAAGALEPFSLSAMLASASADAAVAGTGSVSVSAGRCETYVFVLSDDHAFVQAHARWASPQFAAAMVQRPAGWLVDSLLSVSDALVITASRSMSGHIASGLMQRLPYAVETGLQWRHSCHRLLSMEPCYHGWYNRRGLSCYDPHTFESPATLHMDNCYRVKNPDPQHGEPGCVPCPDLTPSCQVGSTCPAPCNMKRCR